MAPIDIRFKYLGYRLKRLGYRVSYWNWMVEMFEKKINSWNFRLLSLGGHLILIKYVLTGIGVYWFALARFPSSILNALRLLTFNFLWGKSNGNHHFHLVNCKSI